MGLENLLSSAGVRRSPKRSPTVLPTVHVTKKHGVYEQVPTIRTDPKRANEDIDTIVQTRDYLKQNNPELNDADLTAILEDLQNMQKRRREYEAGQPVTLKAYDMPPLKQIATKR